jgi:hypothetical protein
MCSDLLEDGVEVEILWNPAHVGLEDNAIVDERARHTALNGAVFERPLLPVDFQGLARSVLMRVAGEVRNCRHWLICSLHTPEGFSSTLIEVLEGQSKDRKFVSTVSRIMSGLLRERYVYV